MEDGNKREALTTIYSEFGLPLGEAFQLRDDVLGVFGDPSTTGKPAGDDLREGKRTVLMAMTRERATSTQERIIAQYFGAENLDSVGVEVLQTIITETGALQHVEDLIGKLTLTAQDALNRDEIASSAHALLDELASIAVRRSA